MCWVIGGTTPGSGHDQLIVSNAATLDGTLNLVYTNGFTASEGDEFVIVEAGTVTPELLQQRVEQLRGERR